MDSQKVEAVETLESPKMVFEVISVLGLTGYYRRFVEEFSKLAFPLTELKKRQNLSGRITARRVFRS